MVPLRRKFRAKRVFRERAVIAPSVETKVLQQSLLKGAVRRPVVVRASQ